MKYMGSKRAMLQNGLGELLTLEGQDSSRIVDLFSGSGSVSWFASTKLRLPVLAVDLQTYAAVLAASVIERKVSLNVDEINKTWLLQAKKWAEEHEAWDECLQIDSSKIKTTTWCRRARRYAESFPCDDEHVVSSSYAGYYFSLTQGLVIDGMLNSLPERPQTRMACLAAVIIASSRCAASPGHTAQPFQPTESAAKYIQEAWAKDPVALVAQTVSSLSKLKAVAKGKAIVGDATQILDKLTDEDLVFVDPPYSDVHYSRFYHVLETIARQKAVQVSGVGRYPPFEERPVSAFSRKAEAREALVQLLSGLAESGAKVALTFPAGDASNGLSGELVKELAQEWFTINKHMVKTRFSTLGGNNSNRSARVLSDEMILVMRPLDRQRR